MIDINSLASDQKKATRDGFGEGLQIVGQRNPDVIGLCADLIGSLKMQAFIKDNPDRFIQVGIAEANMMGMSAGLALSGKVPYACTFANFATGRVYDQIRQSIAYSHKNVKICASHAGLTLGEDGATHQILEDLGLMKMLPGFTVINPCDAQQTKEAAIAIADYDGPVYLRFGRPSWPVFTPEGSFKIGKAIQFNEGSDVSIFAIGHLMWYAIEASKALIKEGISVDLYNIHTIKPLDETAIIESVNKTGCVVSAEEHQKNGGLGDSIAQVISQHCPAPQEYVAVQDSFGESGKPDQLLAKYGLSVDNIIASAKKAMKRKG